MFFFSKVVQIVFLPFFCELLEHKKEPLFRNLGRLLLFNGLSIKMYIVT